MRFALLSGAFPPPPQLQSANNVRTELNGKGCLGNAAPHHFYSIYLCVRRKLWDHDCISCSRQPLPGGQDGDAHRCWAAARCFRKSPQIIKILLLIWFKKKNWKRIKFQVPELAGPRKALPGFTEQISTAIATAAFAMQYQIKAAANTSELEVICRAPDTAIGWRTTQTCTQEEALNGLGSLRSFNIFSLIKLFNSPA